MKQNLVYTSLSNGYVYPIRMDKSLGSGVFGNVAVLEARPEFVCKTIVNKNSYIEYASTWRELDALYHLNQLEGYCRDRENTYIIMRRAEGNHPEFDTTIADGQPGFSPGLVRKFTNAQRDMIQYGYTHLDSATEMGVNLGNIIMKDGVPNLIDWGSSIRSYQFSFFPQMGDKINTSLFQCWFVLVAYALGLHAAVFFAVLRFVLLIINYFVRPNLIYSLPFFAAAVNTAPGATNISEYRVKIQEGLPTFSRLLLLSALSLVLTICLGFITLPLLLEVFELCVIASSLSSVSAILPLLSTSSVVSVVTLLIQAYSFAVVNLGLCYETIGLIMPEKAWRLYTDFEFNCATKPVCFMKRCFYSKPEDVDVELGVCQL